MNDDDKIAATLAARAGGRIGEDVCFGGQPDIFADEEIAELAGVEPLVVMPALWRLAERGYIELIINQSSRQGSIFVARFIGAGPPK